MSKLAFTLFTLSILTVTYVNAANIPAGFTFIGSVSGLGHAAQKTSHYYLSNAIDLRGVADARVGCHDGWKGGELVAIETPEEETLIRHLLSTNGITDATRVWTTGEYAGVIIGWIWYNYATGDMTPIENIRERAWVNGYIPEFGCLSVGGRDFTYGWQSWDCSVRRRYLCEVEEDNCPS